MKFKIDPKFFLFLLLSVVLWQFINLAQPVSVTKPVKLEFQKPSEAFQLTSDSIVSINVRVTSTGLGLLFRSPFKQTYIMRTDGMQKVDSNYFLLATDVENQLQQSFGESIRIEKLFESEVKLPIAPLETKSIPVHPNVRLSFKQNHLQLGDIEVDPSMITIHATEYNLEKLSHIDTELLQLTNLSQDVDTEVPLDFSGVTFSGVSSKTVRIKAKVVRFSEMIFEVPILIPELSSGVKLDVFPPVAKVLCKAPAELLKTLDESSFVVTINFDLERSLGQLPSRLLLKISAQPKDALEVSLLQPDVNFILENK